MTIEITGLAATGRHGVLPSEAGGQRFVADIALCLPQPTGDRLWQTVDYAAVARSVVSQITGEPVALIETLAARIADRLIHDWPRLQSVTVTVHKPAAPIGLPFSDVTCTCTRYQVAQLCVLSLGSNLGDRCETLTQALKELAATPGLAITHVSDIYRSAAVEVDEPQPEYANLVVEALTTLTPHALLAATAAIETAHGRTRPTVHAARTLDIDIIAVGDLEMEDETLTLPHPRAASRAFVLVPWAEIDKNARLTQGPVSELIKHLDGTVERWKTPDI